jgi:hypothetical protein
MINFLIIVMLLAAQNRRLLSKYARCTRVPFAQMWQIWDAAGGRGRLTAHPGAHQPGCHRQYGPLCHPTPSLRAMASKSRARELAARLGRIRELPALPMRCPTGGKRVASPRSGLELLKPAAVAHSEALKRRWTVSKIITAVAFAAIVAPAMPAALAQTRAVPVAAAPSAGIQPEQIRASMIIGSNVYDAQNHDIGSIKDLVLDRDGRVAEVVLAVGSFLGFGGKYVAVRLSDLHHGNNDRLTLDRTKEQLRQMAEYHLSGQNPGAGTVTPDRAEPNAGAGTTSSAPERSAPRSIKPENN